ncbi:MAG TPA: TRC40/GET3/ArsA family transport-energizing ATPase [Ktedonobacterales bacterium]|nr:TRC40/GET3/ArsA family transport-energizing ATPase [Ktedonobacterales bacterium]
MRIILYLGKGGVGKTTISAATAARAAELGKRTLVVSTDLAHSLADCLDRPLTAEPIQVADHLWAQEVNVLEEMRQQWGKVQHYVGSVLKKQGVEEVVAEEMAVIPGMDELISLMNIYRNARDGDFETVVIDAAPTGETMRLLSLPESFLWYVGRTSALQKTALNMARPLLKAFVPSTVNLAESFQRLNERVKALREVLTNGDTSSYRLVVNPEKMVIKEALRAETYLALYNYPIDGVVCNRVLPKADYQDVFMQGLFESQERYRQQIYDTFKPLPIWEAPHLSQEVLGVEALRKLAHTVFGEDDPTQVFYRGAVQELVKNEQGYILRLPLPHVELNKVVLTKRGDEMVVEVGNFKRELTLPAVLTPMDAKVARFVDKNLEIHFEPAAVAS